jgi:hypothetical protein
MTTGSLIGRDIEMESLLVLIVFTNCFLFCCFIPGLSTTVARLELLPTLILDFDFLLMLEFQSFLALPLG